MWNLTLIATIFLPLMFSRLYGLDRPSSIYVFQGLVERYGDEDGNVDQAPRDRLN